MTTGVIADLCADLLIKSKVTPIYGQVEQFVDDYTIEIGGSAALFATQYARLGGQINIYGIVGHDILGHMIQNRISKEGIDTSFITFSENEKTTLGLGLSLKDDRAMLTYKGTLAQITNDWLQQFNIPDHINHLHIASFYLLESMQGDWINFLESCKARGISISLDTNWAPLENWSDVLPILSLIDVFIPNEQEAMLITNEKDIDKAGHSLAQHISHVIIKQAENGATYFRKTERKHYQIPSKFLNNFSIADTTGAGDNFDAGFLIQWLKGKEISLCIETGLFCGTRSLIKMGGIAGQSSPEDLDSVGIRL